MDDRELVRRLLAGDASAQDLFDRTYRDKLYKACVHLLGYQDPEAEDIVQDAFLAAHKQLPQFEFRSSLFHWLYRICMYLCYERIRKRRRQVTQLEEELDQLAQPLALERQHEAKAEDKKRKMLELLESQREKIGEPCRKILDLRDREDRSYGELARILKVPIGTIMSRLARCRDTLKALVLRAMREKND